MTGKYPINNRHGYLALVVLMGAAAGQGCTRGAPPGPPPPVKAPAPSRPPVQAAVSSAQNQAPALVNSFDFSTKKDPFKPFVIITAAPAAAPGKNSPLPIHSFDISQFQLIGIITGGKQNLAMVTDPAGKGYVLKVGMTIGKDEARITAITASGVQLLEQFRDDGGKVRRQHSSFTFPRKP